MSWDTEFLRYPHERKKRRALEYKPIQLNKRKKHHILVIKNRLGLKYTGKVVYDYTASVSVLHN